MRVSRDGGGSRPESAGRGKTRDLHVPGLHPLLWATSQERNFHRMADHCEEADIAKLKAIKAELQRRMHDRMAAVGAWLRKVVLGYYQYHAVPGNTTQLRIFKLRVSRLWQSVLVRRSQRAKMRWERFTPVLNRWIPPPRVLHPYPDARFYATHPS